jgi:hypothetical protein
MLIDCGDQGFHERVPDFDFYWQLEGPSLARLLGFVIHSYGKNAPFCVLLYILIFQGFISTGK